MIRFRMSLVTLLWMFLVFSEDHSGCCLDTVWQLPKPSISHLQAVSDKQSLLVSWLVNHSSLVGDINEIQISRTENHIIIYNKNISASSAGSDEYTWTWTSDLPLECVDHSVRIRHIYNQSVVSPWSEWKNNYGVVAKDTAKIFPFQAVLREGSSAMFCCVPPAGVNITSMSLRNVKYPLISIGTRIKAIAVDNLTIPATIINALLFSCKDTTGKISYCWNYISFPPHKPRNLSCVTSDMKTVTCTWDPGRKRHPHDLIMQTHTLQIDNTDQVPVKCEPSSCTFPAVPQLEEYSISVMVKNELGEETEKYSFNISDRVSPIVEWDRVIPGVTSTTVSWIVQGNLTQLTLLCQVATDPHITSEELICKSLNGCCKVKLEHLLPNTDYSTRVRCSVNRRLWGKWTQPVSFTTRLSKDSSVILNLWRTIKQLSNPHGRNVTLLWTLHVPGSATTVITQGYTVQWSQEGVNRTEWKDSGQTQTEVSIGQGQYNFTVQAVLNSGLTVSDHIIIPKMDDRENRPVVRRLSSSTSGGFNLSWTEQVTATCGYTVEWCILGPAVPCTLQWMKTSKGINTLFLPGRHFKAGCRYKFIISECTENGHRLLEIQTGYSRELKYVQSPSLVGPAQSTSSSVTLEWHYNEDDPAHSAFITGYLVTVQEVGSDTLPGQAASMFNVSVEDPCRKTVTIEGLQPSHEYALSVSALTSKGPGQPASITIRTTTNYSVHLAKILTPILLLLGCIILLWLQRKLLKNGLKEIFVYPAGMNIKTSELQTFLNETDERVLSHKVEDCISCDIEVLNSHPPLNEAINQDSSLLLSCVPFQADYCPQSAALLCTTPALQQIKCITNESYFYPMAEDVSDPHVTFSEIKSSFEPSDCLQKSCSIICDYIPNNTL